MTLTSFLGRRMLWGAVVIAAVAMPVSLTSTGGIRINDACGAEQGMSTCCRDAQSACGSEGQGWYDTGLCGPCSNLHEC